MLDASLRAELTDLIEDVVEQGSTGVVLTCPEHPEIRSRDRHARRRTLPPAEETS